MVSFQRDLSGSTWVFNSVIDTGAGFSIDADFISNSIYFGGFSTTSTSLSYYVMSSTQVYTANGGWTNGEYRTIEFDEDTTNATDEYLIDWLQANAVYVSGGSGFYSSLHDFFGDVANAIRDQKGISNNPVPSGELIPPYAFPSEIRAIPSGGTVATATATGNGTRSISFSVAGEPKMFAVSSDDRINSTDLTGNAVISCIWPVGNNQQLKCNFFGAGGSGDYVTVSTANQGVVYSAGTLTINTSSIYTDWLNGKSYTLLYIY